ncbi:AMP-binding protein [Actinokineospora soli]|uniref:AMP-binding protein n=1 Tax=Actinokineospora soli TaxID=1048753 RepID=A0ABW2TQI1_9PSEU
MRVALTAALSFDTSWEGLLALVTGHELHLIDDDTRRDPDALVDYVARERVDLLDLTPSFAQEAVAAGLLADPRHRPRVLMLGGEAASRPLWTDLRAARDTEGHNYYGPTECTVDTLGCRVDSADVPVIGKPWPTRGRTCSTPGCGPRRSASPASCTSPGSRWRADTTACPA